MHNKPFEFTVPTLRSSKRARTEINKDHVDDTPALIKVTSGIDHIFAKKNELSRLFQSKIRSLLGPVYSKHRLGTTHSWDDLGLLFFKHFTNAESYTTTNILSMLMYYVVYSESGYTPMCSDLFQLLLHCLSLQTPSELPTTDSLTAALLIISGRAVSTKPNYISLNYCREYWNNFLSVIKLPSYTGLLQLEVDKKTIHEVTGFYRKLTSSYDVVLRKSLLRSPRVLFSERIDTTTDSVVLPDSLRFNTATMIDMFRTPTTPVGKQFDVCMYNQSVVEHNLCALYMHMATKQTLPVTTLGAKITSDKTSGKLKDLEDLERSAFAALFGLRSKSVCKLVGNKQK